MRICIFGAGAVGSHFAVRLALAGHEVSCVMRGPHLAAVKAQWPDACVSAMPSSGRDVKASDDPADLGPQDVVISTLKATGVRRSHPACSRCCATIPPIMFAQNGIPWWYDIGLPKNIRRCPTSPSSIPAAGCALRSRRSASSAA